MLINGVVEENSFAMTRTCGRIKQDATCIYLRNPSLRISFRHPIQRIESPHGLPTDYRTPLVPFPRVGESSQERFKIERPQNGVQKRSPSSWMGFPPSTRRSYLP